jgi:glycosyltransferase involved in cell wall biosynthesis
MKIGYMITGLDIGGAQKHLLKLVPNIKHEKFVVSLNKENAIGKQLEKQGIKVYYLGLNKWNLGLSFARMVKILSMEHPDILDSYLIHANLFMKLFEAKRVCSIRNDYSDLKVLNFIEKKTSFFNDLTLVNSPELISYAKANKNKRIKVINNGIDFDEIESVEEVDIRKELGLKKDVKLVISTARLEEHKNVEDLVVMWESMPKDVHLIIAGDGSAKKDVKMRVLPIVKDRIHFLGNRDDVLGIVKSCDVFALTSSKEGMSNALLEAMALKKPCVVSAIPQNEELIKDGKNGVVYPGFTAIPTALKEALAKNNYGEEAYKLVKKKYDIKDTIKLYEKAMEVLVNGK